MGLEKLAYAHLIDRFGLDVTEPPIASFLLERGSRRTQIVGGRREEYYPPRDNPGPHWIDHLKFALKHEGVNLEVLSALFQAAPTRDLAAWIKKSPTSRYTRTAWFLYEWLLKKELPVSDLNRGNYFPVLDQKKYYTLPREKGANGEKRYRVLNNLLGTPTYCPFVRRTDELSRFEGLRLDKRAADLIKPYPAELLYRAAQYLYAKETKSSYAIEHLTSDKRRTARFVGLLQQAGELDCFTEAGLIHLQNVIVEDRYAATGFRDFQNYVGQSLGPMRELVHYVPPKPENLPGLMEGWMSTCRRLQAEAVHPVLTATVAGFGFVFLHPFDDGNGRLHRFLLHHVLAAGAFSPPGMVFPVSATMLKQMSRYDAALETYSREIAKHVEYELDDEGGMTVTNDTLRFYRYPDLTVQAEALFGFIQETIETEMVSELEYLAAFDSATKRIRRVVDMPDRRLSLFIRLCLQGKGRLSKSKRKQFKELTDKECAQLEKIVGAEISRLRSLPEE